MLPQSQRTFFCIVLNVIQDLIIPLNIKSELKPFSPSTCTVIPQRNHRRENITRKCASIHNWEIYKHVIFHIFVTKIISMTLKLLEGSKGIM